MQAAKWIPIVVVAVVLASCAAPAADPLPAGADDSSAEQAGDATQEPAPIDDPQQEGAPSVHDELVRQAKIDLRARLGVTEDKIEVVTVEDVVWSDASAGCPEPGKTYGQVEIQGVVIRLRVAGTFYDYHATPNGEPILCEQADIFANSTPASGASEELGATPQAPPTTGDALAESDPLVQSALADLSQRTGVAADSIEVLKAEKVTWSDGSIGCPQPGVAYTQALVEGTRVILNINGQLFFYHSSNSGDQFLCGENPKPAAPGSNEGIIVLPPGTDEFVPPPGGPDD